MSAHSGEFVRAETTEKKGERGRSREGGKSGTNRSKRGTFVGAVVKFVNAPLREAAYVRHTFSRGMQRPTWQQAASGFVTKAPVFIASVVAWSALLLPTHVVAFLAVVTLSFSLETFHGIFVASWLNVQRFIESERGLPYQVVFNFVYIQFGGGLFRVLAWSSIPDTIPPWSLTYWRDVSFMTVVGSFFGSLGFNGVNALQHKGYLSDNFRAYVEHFRDVFMLGNGIFFGAGLMTIFWTIFAVQQVFDATLYYVGKKLRPKPGSNADLEGDQITSFLEAFKIAMAPFVAIYQLLFPRRQQRQEGPMALTETLHDEEAQIKMYGASEPAHV